MRVSVIIPAHNEEKYIGRCLARLGLQTLPTNQFEVIVVDNGSVDNTLSIVNKFKQSLPLQVISRPNASISAVRNFGASIAKGEIVAFLDADCLPNSEWLTHALQLAPNHSIWGAHYLIPEDATWVSKVWSAYQAKEYDGAVSFIPGSNLFIRHTDFDALKGFDESIRTSEDVEFCGRAREAGMAVIAFRSLAVVHEGIPRSLLQFYRQNRWHGKQLLRLFLRDLPSTRNFSIVAISLYTLVAFWAMIIAFVAACVLHQWFLPVVPALLLLLPPLLLSARKTAGTHSVIASGSLLILYTTYLLARAAALTHTATITYKSWKD